ncbi:MAG: chemotaxis protein CheE [Alphaproteobacteria bacterium]
MSKVRKFKVKTKLSTAALRGGITAAEAINRADAALEPYRGEALVVIDALLAEMASRFGPHAAGRDGEDLEALYMLSSRVIDASIGLSEAGVDRAAHALCTLIDLSQESGIRDWEAIDVHLEAVRLLRLHGLTFSPAEQDRVLDGLKTVTAKRVGDPDQLKSA